MILLFFFATVISVEGFRSCCDVTIDSPSPPARSIQKGDTVFVDTSALDFFFAKIFPNIEEPFILVSSQGIGTVDEKYLSYLQSKNLAHWFGADLILRHPKATCIPIGVSWVHKRYTPLIRPYLSQLTKGSYFAQKPFSIYINWDSSTHPSRKSIRDFFADFPNCTFSRRVPFAKYMEELAHSRFIISPRGKNIDCFRNWEALYAGSIPVVESHGIEAVFESLPVIVIDDLLHITESFLIDAFENLKAQPLNIEKLHLEYWVDQIRKKAALIYYEK